MMHQCIYPLNFDNVDMSQTIKETHINRTKPNSKILIYNRIPKCASTTMNDFISKLRKRNHFYVKHSNLFWK